MLQLVEALEPALRASQGDLEELLHTEEYVGAVLGRELLALAVRFFAIAREEVDVQLPPRRPCHLAERPRAALAARAARARHQVRAG